MKTADPDTLGYFALLGDGCHKFDIDQIVRGVLIRARIKPISYRETIETGRTLWLNVELECIENQRDVRTFHLEVAFYTLNHGATLMYTPGYVRFGNQDPQTLTQFVRDNVEMAVADYLEAQTKF